jgi:putative aminopeptidase FrvX
MGLVTIIAALRELMHEGLPLDLYFVATSGEEIGFLGALRAAHLLQPEIAIAIDTSPVVPDTPAVVSAAPVIWYGEASFHLKSDCDTLLRLANELGFGAQPAVYNSSMAASDAGGIKTAGLASRTVAFGFARENSHGYEIAHIDALPNVTQLLVAFLKHLATQP